MQRSRPAFTLLELLVVIGIIAILIAVTLVVGNAVTGNSKKQLTTDTLRVLENALAAVSSETGEAPAPIVEDPRATAANPRPYLPVADARNMDDTDPAPVSPPGNQIIDSVGLFMLQVSQEPKGKAVLDQLPTRLVRQRTTRVAGANMTVTSVFDAWGRPIRYVHPAFDGLIGGDISSPSPDMPRVLSDQIGLPRMNTAYAVQNIRRNASTILAPGAWATAQDSPDSDGGTCVGNRPYFYSAGPDGRVGAFIASGDVSDNYNDDNIYTTPPTLPAKYR